MGTSREDTALPIATDANLAIPMLDLGAQYASIQDEIHSAIDEVLEAQHFILGPNVEALEKEVAGYCGRQFAGGVASGTDALVLAARAAGIGPSDDSRPPSFHVIGARDFHRLCGVIPALVELLSRAL